MAIHLHNFCESNLGVQPSSASHSTRRQIARTSSGHPLEFVVYGTCSSLSRIIIWRFIHTYKVLFFLLLFCTTILTSHILLFSMPWKKCSNSYQGISDRPVGSNQHWERPIGMVFYLDPFLPFHPFFMQLKTYQSLERYFNSIILTIPFVKLTPQIELRGIIVLKCSKKQCFSQKLSIFTHLIPYGLRTVQKYMKELGTLTKRWNGLTARRSASHCHRRRCSKWSIRKPVFGQCQMHG